MRERDTAWIEGAAFTLLELLSASRPAWQADAACREHPQLDWFSNHHLDQREAKAVCSGCLVLDECRTWAMAQGNELVGVWGGMATSERRRRRRSAA